MRDVLKKGGRVKQMAKKNCRYQQNKPVQCSGTYQNHFDNLEVVSVKEADSEYKCYTSRHVAMINLLPMPAISFGLHISYS